MGLHRQSSGTLDLLSESEEAVLQLFNEYLPKLCQELSLDCSNPDAAIEVVQELQRICFRKGMAADAKRWFNQNDSTYAVMLRRTFMSFLVDISLLLTNSAPPAGPVPCDRQLSELFATLGDSMSVAAHVLQEDHTFKACLLILTYHAI